MLWACDCWGLSVGRDSELFVALFVLFCCSIARRAPLPHLCTSALVVRPARRALPAQVGGLGCAGAVG